MFLQDKYNITTTTDLEVVKCISKNSDVDLVLMDTEPSPLTEGLCKNIKNKNSNLPIILTYVYKKQFAESDKKIRKMVNSVFYKPYDLNEIAVKMSSLIV